MRVYPVLFVAAIAASVPTQGGQTTPQVAREQTADQQVRHVLNRLAFGPRPGDYDKVRKQGVDAWIAEQLYPEKIADPAVPQLISQLPTYTASTAQLVQEYPPPAQTQQMLARARTAADTQAIRQQRAGAGRPGGLLQELQAERVGRAVVTERQLDEVLTDFWLNHFSVFAGKNAQMRYHLASYERDVIRPHVFGKFRDMLEAVAKSPAMLIYLDNTLSQSDSAHVTTTSFGLSDQQRARGRGRAGFPVGRGGVVRGFNSGVPAPPIRGRANGLNENYARELMELHTLGVDGGYTQHDVTEVARALTGWAAVPAQLEAQMMGATTPAAGRGRGGAGGRQGRAAAAGEIEGEFVFRPQVHDAEAKTVLGVKLKAGRGIEDGEQVLDIVAHHPSTAKFIAKELSRRFVSDSPPPALVARAAEVFTKTDGDLREVVRTIITSPEFFSAAAYRSKVKSPFEVVVSAIRAVGAPADPTPRTAQLVATLGQPIFGRQTPDGWPETGGEWVNTGAILNRINFGLALAAGRVPGSNQNTWPLPMGIRRESREAQVDAVVAAFLGGEVSAETRSVLMQGTNPLLTTAAPDTSDMRAMRQTPPDTARVSGVDPLVLRQAAAGRAFQQLPSLEGVPLIVGLAIGSPEFQRR